MSASVVAREAGAAVRSLRIGCAPGLPLQRLLSVLGSLCERRPPLEPEIVHLPGAEQLERVRAGELDIALVHGVHDETGIEATPVFPGERLRAFLAPGHSLGSRRSLAPADVRGEVLLTPTRCADPAPYDAVLTRLECAGYRFRAIQETIGAELRDVLLSVAAGHGIAFGPLCTQAELGQLATIATSHALDVPVSMPDTMIAWSAELSSARDPLALRARDVARVLTTDARDPMHAGLSRPRASRSSSRRTSRRRRSPGA